MAGHGMTVQYSTRPRCQDSEMEKASMILRAGLVRRMAPNHLAASVIASILVLSLARPASATAQEVVPTGSISGKGVDQEGAAIAGAQVFLAHPAAGARTRGDGAYSLSGVPAGAQTLRALSRGPSAHGSRCEGRASAGTRWPGNRWPPIADTVNLPSGNQVLPFPFALARITLPVIFRT